jgi:hypothetical protein
MTEYLCDYCDSVFSSPLLVKKHQQKSCIGSIIQKDDMDEWKKIEYIESTSINPKKCQECGMVFIERGLDKRGKNWKDWKDWKEKNIKCVECQEKEKVLNCEWPHYVKKYH